MQKKFGGIFSIIVCAAAAVILATPAWADGEVFVAGANASGDAMYMRSNGDGSFTPLEILQESVASGIPIYNAVSYGNGIGDFDMDGHNDYIFGTGYDAGDVYLAAGDGTGFALPTSVTTWSLGIFAMDIGVGDFNGDGKPDFVMSHSGSISSGVYLNTSSGDPGNFSFAYSKVGDSVSPSAPRYSAGIDVADFDGDGFDDFVVASNTPGEPIYVNLSNCETPGENPVTFTPMPFATAEPNALWGIAAGDFNGDHIPDIVTAYDDSLILYTGNESATEEGKGDGTFTWAATYVLEVNQSAIDNYDFDGDGDQDLVVSSYGSDLTAIAILLNDGKGVFTLSATYPGIVGELVAVAAPPYVPSSNTEPVAQLAAYTYEATVGEAIEFDGSQSYDDDGDLLTYQWDFGDGSPIVEGDAAMVSHAFTEPDTYTVILTVMDDKGAMNSVQAEVHVSAVPASVAFYPYLLDLHSRDKWITASIRVPSGYDARKIDVSTVQIVFEDGTFLSADSNRRFGFFGFIHKLFRKYGHSNTLTVKFNQRALSKALAGASGDTLLKVEGKINSNGNMVDFSGEGVVKVIGKHKKIAHHGKKHGWK